MAENMGLERNYRGTYEPRIFGYKNSKICLGSTQQNSGPLVIMCFMFQTNYHFFAALIWLTNQLFFVTKGHNTESFFVVDQKIII